MKIILNLPVNLNPQKMYDELAEKRGDSTDLIKDIWRKSR
jgi:hypothetical protein